MAAHDLTEGEWALAKIAAVQLRVPDLPDAPAISCLRGAGGLQRFNQNHYPGGSSRGGQFAPSDRSAGTINVADSPAHDITRRKFGSDEDAARSALKYFYEASKRAGLEYAGVIYRDKDGTYGITAPTTENDGNDLHNSRIHWSDVPDGARPMASYHTHLRTDDPYADERFSAADSYIARKRGVKSYIATPSGAAQSVRWDDPFRGRSGATLMAAPSLLSRLRYMAAFGVITVLGSCAAPATRQIDFDQAVAIADAAARRGLSPNRPLRVLIATEKDVRSVKRCLDDDHDLAYVQSVREKVAGRSLYVIRYPLPPITREDGDADMTGTEPCVLIDRDTGEVLGVFYD